MDIDQAILGYQKTCKKCGAEKPTTDFYKNPLTKDGLLGSCKDCTSNQAKSYRKQNRKALAQYEQHRSKDTTRLLKQRYKSMKQRANGKDKFSSANGLGLLSWSEFVAWCIEPKNWESFWSLYKAWVNSGYDNKLSPSIDRINSKVGYTEENIQWLTRSANSSKGDK